MPYNFGALPSRQVQIQNQQRFFNGVGQGFRQGVKDLIGSYTGTSKEENIFGKASSAVVGGYVGYKSSKNSINEQIKNATSRAERGMIEKSAASTITKGVIKGAIKGIGVVGLIPDVITFAKGFAKGFSSVGN